MFGAIIPPTVLPRLSWPSHARLSPQTGFSRASPRKKGLSGAVETDRKPKSSPGLCLRWPQRHPQPRAQSQESVLSTVRREFPLLQRQCLRGMLFTGASSQARSVPSAGAPGTHQEGRAPFGQCSKPNLSKAELATLPLEPPHPGSDEHRSLSGLACGNPKRGLQEQRVSKTHSQTLDWFSALRCQGQCQGRCQGLPRARWVPFLPGDCPACFLALLVTPALRARHRGGHSPASAQLCLRFPGGGVAWGGCLTPEARAQRFPGRL